MRDATSGMSVENHAARWDGDLDGRLSLEMSFGPPSQRAWDDLVDFLRRPALTL